MGRKINNVLFSIAAIVAGVSIALLIAMPILFLAGFFVFSDSEIDRSALLIHTILLIAAAMASGFVAGFISNKVYNSIKYLHPTVAAFVLIFLSVIDK